MNDINKIDDQASQIILELVIESWRFSRLFEKLLSKLDAGESHKYITQFKYYLNQLEGNLEKIGCKLANLEGQPFNVGMAVTPLNLEDFEPNDPLIIEQMIEPIIMGPEGVLRTGTVILRKAHI
jgi:hypothetical protein